MPRHPGQPGREEPRGFVAQIVAQALSKSGDALAGMRGATAGWIIAGLLVLFSLARGGASIASKDTLGKTVSKGRRGRVGGYAGTVSGLVAGAVGLYLVLSPAAARPKGLLYALIVAAGLSWFAAIAEHPGATEGGRGIVDLLGEQVSLLFSDRQLQLFLIARTLMISTSLTGPVYVALAQQGMGNALDSLGWLILASGLAGTLSSSFWGLFSDRSSRATMAAGAGIAAALGIGTLIALSVSPDLADSRFFFAVLLFILGISHAGVRIGRKTHIVDMAGPDRKAEYVALSNTLIGVLLLVIGAAVGVLMSIGLKFALIVLSVLALLGAATTLAMKNVQE